MKVTTQTRRKRKLRKKSKKRRLKIRRGTHLVKRK